MVTKMARLSATVPKYIIDYADAIAAARKLSRSQLISECLNEMIQRMKQQLLVEGYKAMAEKHKEFASLSENAAKDTLPNW